MDLRAQRYVKFIACKVASGSVLQLSFFIALIPEQSLRDVIAFLIGYYEVVREASRQSSPMEQILDTTPT